MSNADKSIFENALAKGRELGYMEALRDMIDKEEKVLLMVDDNQDDPNFQLQTFVVESKHIRTMIKALVRDKKQDN